MMSDLERADYLTHVKRLIGECTTLLDAYHLGEDRPIFQRTLFLSCVGDV